MFINDGLFVGIMFQDITTLLLNPKAFKDTVDLFVERYKGKNISVVAGIITQTLIKNRFDYRFFLLCQLSSFGFWMLY